MINKAKCEEIINFAIKHAGRRVDGLEVSVDGSNIATSRFAVNGMTQNQSPDCVSVSVRAIKSGVRPVNPQRISRPREYARSSTTPLLLRLCSNLTKTSYPCRIRRS